MWDFIVGLVSLAFGIVVWLASWLIPLWVGFVVLQAVGCLR